jgi:hypothetical protein
MRTWKEIESYPDYWISTTFDEADYYIFYNLFRELNKSDVTVLEVGSYLGRSALAFKDIFEKLNMKWSIHCMDSWINIFDRSVPVDRDYTDFLQNIEGSGITHEKLPFKYPMNWNDFKNDKNYNVIYIDACHRKKSTIRNMEYWFPWCTDLMVVDDLQMKEVREAVEDFTKIYNIEFTEHKNKAVFKLNE